MSKKVIIFIFFTFFLVQSNNFTAVLREDSPEQMKKRFNSLVDDLLQRAQSFFAEAKSEESLRSVWTDVVSDFQNRLYRFSAYPEYGYTEARAEKMLAKFAEGLEILYNRRLKQLGSVPDTPKAPWE